MHKMIKNNIYFRSESDVKQEVLGYSNALSAAMQIISREREAIWQAAHAQYGCSLELMRDEIKFVIVGVFVCILNTQMT